MSTEQIYIFFHGRVKNTTKCMTKTGSVSTFLEIDEIVYKNLNI